MRTPQCSSTPYTVLCNSIMYTILCMYHIDTTLQIIAVRSCTQHTTMESCTSQQCDVYNARDVRSTTIRHRQQQVYGKVSRFSHNPWGLHGISGIKRPFKILRFFVFRGGGCKDCSSLCHHPHGYHSIHHRETQTP